MLAPTDGSVARDRRLPATALVVVEQRSTLGEQVVLRQQIVMTRAGSAVEYDDNRTRSNLPAEEMHYSRTASASAISLTSACSRSPNPFGTSESMSIWPRM